MLIPAHSRPLHDTVVYLMNTVEAVHRHPRDRVTRVQVQEALRRSTGRTQSARLGALSKVKLHAYAPLMLPLSFNDTSWPTLSKNRIPHTCYCSSEAGRVAWKGPKEGCKTASGTCVELQDLLTTNFLLTPESGLAPSTSTPLSFPRDELG